MQANRSPAERIARKIVVSIVGFTTILLGIIMIVTPGPGFLVILGGLAILAVEFAWAKRWLAKVKETGKLFWSRKGKSTTPSSPSSTTSPPTLPNG
ncbi:MAG: PGPGW domain-containing protein [Planctomycetota bacterium]|nr:PGPGW domain-containing protein [Planctomycetota bacterium]